MRDAFACVMSFLDVVDDGAGAGGLEEGGAEETDCIVLRIDNSISDDYLSSILHVFPSKGPKGYDGLQTGSIVDSGDKRQNRQGEWDERGGLFACCIIL